MLKIYETSSFLPFSVPLSQHTRIVLVSEFNTHVLAKPEGHRYQVADKLWCIK